jgi:hypothetical protein
MASTPAVRARIPAARLRHTGDMMVRNADAGMV